jgi:hypothetical protein
MANSCDGAKINNCSPSFGTISGNNGHVKASVLPVPVGAKASIDCPSAKGLATASCIGVKVVNPTLVKRSSNGNPCFLLNI